MAVDRRVVMNSHWKAWAAQALRYMDEHGIEDADARFALEHVYVTGCEPYYTLKGWVYMTLDGDRTRDKKVR